MPDFEGYELVMPLVVVTSKGGPFDDNAYAAGWEAGAFMETLRALARAGLPASDIKLHMPVRAANVPQLDLIAMDAGWAMQTDPADDGFWVYVTLTEMSDADPSPPAEG